MRSWKVINLGVRVIRRTGLCLAGGFAMLNLSATATMAVSMLVSLAVYAVAFGLKFAIGFIILLLIHEMGHWVASRVVGLNASAPMFIPFLGAVINLRQSPVNAKMEANVAIGGPAAGTLSALLCLLFYLWTDSLFMLVLSYTACLLNLFNLIPCVPLDGERIAAAISSRIWLFGSVILAILCFTTHNIFIFVIFVVSLFRLWHGEGDYAASYYHLTRNQRLKVAFWYFGLLSVLGTTTVYVVGLLR
ncbi:Hypothetical protein LUCI_0701 [Lucifera butyrica]|uniref:Peptidase M50 domain-containing protein n=1 Tax=Lucifera butyrica TaxID=1351585 RepID=A0A498R277_9FIRM|nr:site-2 protease family protein [Lucifera butyrica]VBB05491.1 Hypothetical protein LUCI_0701 [Lucifera butyrica]